MELGDPFKPDVLRPFISVVVPGLIAVSPFVLLLGYYVPAVEAFWTHHGEVFAAFFAVAVLSAGFIISDFGELIEVYCWDSRLLQKDSKFDENWHSYLRLQLNDELIAQRFLRTKFTQFKFELAMSPALVIFWIGLLWLQAVKPLWSWKGFVLFSTADLALAGYLVWESWNSAKLLANTREDILLAIKEGPKGISRSRDCGGGAGEG